MILAKWKSVIRHVANEHDEHPDPLFPKCVHGEELSRNWIKVGKVCVCVCVCKIICITILARGKQ